MTPDGEPTDVATDVRHATMTPHRARAKCPDCGGSLTVQIQPYRRHGKRKATNEVFWSCMSCGVSTFMQGDFKCKSGKVELLGGSMNWNGQEVAL